MQKSDDALNVLTDLYERNIQAEMTVAVQRKYIATLEESVRVYGEYTAALENELSSRRKRA